MIITQLLTIILIIGFAFIVVAAEIALLQIKKSDIDNDNKYAMKMIENKNEFMSTIQVGITISSMLAGFAGEPSMTKIIMRTGIQHLIGDKLTTTIAFGLITVISIVLSELLPKNIAMAFPKETLYKVIIPIRIIHTIFYPVVWFLDKSSAIITKQLGIPVNPNTDLLNEASLLASLRIAASTEESDIQEADVSFIKNIIKLNDTKIQDIMTPIDKISFDNRRFSRVPHQNFEEYVYNDKTYPLYKISANTTADKALSQMTSQHTGILAIEENSKVIGILSNTDIFEVIYPELFDEKTISQKE